MENVEIVLILAIILIVINMIIIIYFVKKTHKLQKKNLLLECNKNDKIKFLENEV